MKKTEQVRKLMEQGDYKTALRIAKSFRINVTEAQRDAMTRAYECMVNPRFYASIGTNLAKAIEDGVAVLNEMFS